MANFFTRALDKVTPWRRGGEVQRDLQAAPKKKKKEDEQSSLPIPSVGVARPNQNIVVGNQQSQPVVPKKATNIFEDLNKSLTLGKRPDPVPVFNNVDTTPAPLPQPGTVVKPVMNVDVARPEQRIVTQDGRPAADLPVIQKPKQGFWNKVRDKFDANTEADQYRRQQGNIQKGENKDIVLKNPGNIISRAPIVGNVTKMLNTGAAQIAQLPATADGIFQSRMYDDLTKKFVDAKKNGRKYEAQEYQRKMDILLAEMDKTRAQQDAGNSMFQKNSGGLFNAGTLYDEQAAIEGDIGTGIKEIALPTAVTMLDAYTLGQGNLISEGLKAGIPKLGFNAAVRDVLPNIVRAAGGNYASGDLGARAEGATGWDPVKAGATNAVLGTVPDVGLPMLGSSFKNRVLSKIFKGKYVNPKDVVEELDDAAISASAEAAIQATKPRPISIGTDIPVEAAESFGENIRVRNMNEPGRLIQEVAGDATTATPNALVQQTAADVRTNAIRETAFDQAKTAGLPDRRIEGVAPSRPKPVYNLDDAAIKSGQDGVVDEYAKMLRNLGEGNGVQMVPDGEGGYIRVSNNMRTGLGSEKMSKAAWREEAERQLRAGKADSAVQKAFNDAADPEVQALLNKGDVSGVNDTPPNNFADRPITVKQANSIPVTDDAVIPTGLPETPGTVRATVQKSPMNEKTVAAGIAPVTTRPVQLPADVQEVLDNPKQFNKRQVAAARNQRKLARQMAKTTEDTAAAIERIDTASPAATSGEGFVPTGEFGKSVNGGAYQKVSRAGEMAQAVQETSQMSPGDVLQTARRNQGETGGFNRRDIRNIAALFESKRIPRGTPEWKEARQILKEDGTVWGQTGALRNYTMRRTASADELVSRYEGKIYRLADDPSKIDGKWFDEVEAAEGAYTQARDDALTAYNRFTEAPTSANAKVYHAAMDAADKADKAAKMTEYKVAEKALKGNKDVKQVRELQKMANDADMYQMDTVDASMLSGTGTFVRNFVNSAVGGTEEGLFGGIASRISRKLTGQDVGGGMGRGSISGFREGVSNVVDASKARAGNAGKNPLSHIKNWATTGNQLGDTIIDSQVKHNVVDHYTQLLKEQGYTGRELADRASVMARQDPDELGKTYAGYARAAAGLGNGVTRGNKFETIIKNGVSDLITFGNPNQASEFAGKLFARMTVGFPTAIGRSAKEGAKRVLAPTVIFNPSFIQAAVTKDPLKRALLIKEGIKQAGTGAAAGSIFYMLGQQGMITGGYPEDKEERARWERDGITENSIKIGENYYQLPGYMGSAALPAVFAASLGRNEGDVAKAVAEVTKALPSMLPTDQASNVMDFINGRSDPGKYITQTGASAVRAMTPAGALLNQISKSFDPTKNDTNSGTNLENFVDKVLGGIPGVNNMADIPDKLDDAGNPIQNPNPLALAFGASSAVQGKGEERSAQIQADVDTGVQALDEVLNDSNLQAVLDDKERVIYDKLKSGKKLGEGDLKKLQDAFVKGVSTTGDDTAYLERGQYDSNLAALKLKRQLMDSDKTVKPSDLAKMDTAIKRGEIYKEKQLPYDMIDAYQTTGIDEWRKMGDPEDDEYDPDMYQKLWEIDETMTKAGVSYKKGAMDKNKFYAKESKKTGGTGSRGGYSSDFGQLKASQFAPNVQNYETIDQKSGNVPIIRTVRPNIVHKIGSSG